MKLGARQRQVLGVVGLVLVALVWWFVDQGGSEDSSAGRSGTDSHSGLSWIAEEDLPDEAQETLELIDEGGPFPYDRDGITFENREEILPEAERGHYREYTVETPGSSDRGARRIVTGGEDEFYWTEDHYSSFERIAR